MNRFEEMIQRNPGQPLLGLGMHRCDLALVEMMAMMGFQAVWIEMEHLAMTFAEAANLCRLSSSLGLLTMIRIPNANRDNVLRAAECGPDIIDVPMANTTEVMRELMSHARYPPEGNRGFFAAARAQRYGLGDISLEQRRINEQLCLMAQIETLEAVERADELCVEESIDAIFLGPGDMSASLGVPGQIDHPLVQEALDRAIASATRHGKLLAMACRPATAASFFRKGVSLLFLGSDMACLKVGAQALLRESRGDESGASPVGT